MILHSLIVFPLYHLFNLHIPKTFPELLLCGKHFRDTKKNETRSTVSWLVRSQWHSLLEWHASSFISLNPHIPRKGDRFLPVGPGWQSCHPVWVPHSGLRSRGGRGCIGCRYTAFFKCYSDGDIILWPSFKVNKHCSFLKRGTILPHSPSVSTSQDHQPLPFLDLSSNCGQGTQPPLWKTKI